MKKELRQRVYAKYKNKCGYCGHSINYSDMQVDHIIPQKEFITVITYSYFKFNNEISVCCNRHSNIFSLSTIFGVII